MVSGAGMPIRMSSATGDLAGPADDAAPPAAAPHRVRVPVNLHRWDRISFLHYRYRVAEVAPLVPPGLDVLTRGGAAWVSVTPFVMHVRRPGFPMTWTFPETNVRTYVRDRDGREGLWFLRLEADSAWFVAALRALGLPYVRQRMTVEQHGDVLTYDSTPARASRGGGHHIVVRPGAPLPTQTGDPWERFVTSRWRAFHRLGPALLSTPVEHPPWPLQEAEVATAEVGGLLRDVGLPPPADLPVAHFCAGVVVRVGVPRVRRFRPTRG